MDSKAVTALVWPWTWHLPITYAVIQHVTITLLLASHILLLLCINPMGHVYTACGSCLAAVIQYSVMSCSMLYAVSSSSSASGYFCTISSYDSMLQRCALHTAIPKYSDACQRSNTGADTKAIQQMTSPACLLLY